MDELDRIRDRLQEITEDGELAEAIGSDVLSVAVDGPTNDVTNPSGQETFAPARPSSPSSTQTTRGASSGPWSRARSARPTTGKP